MSSELAVGSSLTRQTSAGSLSAMGLRREKRFALTCCSLWAAALLAGCSKPPVVEVVPVETRRLEVSFSERAETVLRKDFPVSLPVSGRISRIELEPGDRVRKGERLVGFDTLPIATEVAAQDARVEGQRMQQETLSQTDVELREAEAARRRLLAIQAESARFGPTLEAARTELANAKAELSRVEALVSGGALPSQRLETARLALEQARARIATLEAEREVLKARESEAVASADSWKAQAERRQSQARAQGAAVDEASSARQRAQHELSKTEIVSPIDGVVLSREVRGPQELAAGTVLLRLGRLEDLEALCDVLSQDALALRRGTPVLLDPGSGQAAPLHGEVRLKEPQGFTKRSSLGVEQQRVRVRISLLDPPKDLGTGYELWARFVLDRKTAPSLPSSCFIKQADGYAVWAVRDGKLRKLAIEVGTKGDRHWEIQGQTLKKGDRVVRSPEESLSEGLEVTAQSAGQDP